MIHLELHQLDLRHEHLRRTSPSRERRLMASLADVGQQSPIIVVASDDSAHVVVDGYKRVRALRLLGRDTVGATKWALEESEAMVLEKILRQGDDDSALEQGWFLKALRERFGLGLEDLARRFDRTPSWVSRRLALVEALPEVIREQVRSGKIQPHLAMKYLVPLARANEDDCVRLVKSIAPLHVTSRQMAALYSAYFSTTPNGRELLLAEPQLFLRAETETKRKEACGRTPKEMVLSDLTYLGAVARRLLRHLRELPLHCLMPSELEDLGRCSAQTEADLKTVIERLRKGLIDAGPQHPISDPPTS